jgi:hypothetical protein
VGARLEDAMNAGKRGESCNWAILKQLSDHRMNGQLVQTCPRELTMITHPEMVNQ